MKRPILHFPVSFRAIGIALFLGAAAGSSAQAQQSAAAPSGGSPSVQGAPFEEGVDSMLVEAIGLLPNQKKSVNVPADEPNPFAVVTSSVEKNENFEDATVQEAKIRQFFSSVSIGGVSRSGSDARVMIGGMILSEGDRVPPVLPNQTERLEVVKIDDDKVEIAWVEDGEASTSRSAINRSLTIPLNPLKARVRSGLPGGVVGGDVAGGDGYLYREKGDFQEELRLPLEQAGEPAGE